MKHCAHPVRPRSRQQRFVGLVAGSAAALVLLLGLSTGEARAQLAPTADQPAIDDNSSTVVQRILSAPAGPARSGDELEALTEELASEMRCPVCQGLSIAASRSISALNMKTEVRELLAAGYSPEQVLDYFEQSYGEFVRLTPKPKGVNLLVWILPIAGLLVGAVLIARHRGREHRRQGESSSEENLDDYRRRVAEETAGEGVLPP